MIWISSNKKNAIFSTPLAIEINFNQWYWSKTIDMRFRVYAILIFVIAEHRKKKLQNNRLHEVKCALERSYLHEKK